MYHQIYQALVAHYEQAADQRQATLFIRRRDTAQMWRILADLERGVLLLPEDRSVLKQSLDDEIIRVQKTDDCLVAIDEMGHERPLSPSTLTTLQALSDKIPREAIMTSRDQLVQLYQDLSARFSLEEVRSICFALGVDYDDLPGEGKAAKARELVAYLERRGRTAELAAEMARLRPSAVTPPSAETADPSGLNRPLQMARRTLSILEAQAAAYTALTIPAHLQIELEEQRRKVAELEARLHRP